MSNSSSFTSFISQFHFTDFLPAAPDRFSSVGSTLLSAAIGGAYGLIGRVIYPKAGISPLHYAIWFVLAFQIKQFILSAQCHFGNFLGVKDYLEELENVPEDELDLHDLVRYHSWKVIQLKNHVLHVIDQFFYQIFDIRPYEEIDAENVEEASFLEMCRYRMWPIFKLTVLETLSFALAHRLLNAMGFTIPSQTAVPLFIIIRSVVRDIILVPAVYVYARLCNKLADHLDDGSDEKAAAYRANWIKWCLPAL